MWWIVGDNYCNKKKTCPYSSFRNKICKNRLQKWNLCEKLGKEHLDCKKSTLTKSQRSNLVKVNRQREKSTNDVSKLTGDDVSKWRQLGLTWQLWRQQVNPTACVACEARGLTLPKLRAARDGTWTVRWSRFFFEDADQRKTILMVSTATRSKLPWWRMKGVELFAETLIDTWQHVDGQMSMFLAAMCRAIENLHGDISYVLIGGQRW